MEFLLTNTPVPSVLIRSPNARSSVKVLTFLFRREVFVSLIETPGADFNFAIKRLPETIFSSIVTVNVVIQQIYNFKSQGIVTWVPENQTKYFCS
jgi:hypothetical protein